MRSILAEGRLVVITDPSERYIISCLGWVDHGDLWRYDVKTGQESVVALGDADHVVLRAGAEDLFTAAQHFSGDRMVVTVQSFEQPERPIAQLDVRGWRPTMTGNDSAWVGLERAHVCRLNDDATGADGYFVAVVNGDHASVNRLDWFDGNYDHMYQSVIAVATVPESHELLFGVQRSSDLVLWSSEGGAAVRHIRLTGHLGNPEPFVRRSAPEIWAVDYDTVVRLDRRSWRVTGDIRADAQMFLGRLGWTAEEQWAVVPRPGRGDVLLIAPVSLTIDQAIELGRQPLEAAVLRTGLVVARDWKTGDLLLGP